MRAGDFISDTQIYLTDPHGDRYSQERMVLFLAEGLRDVSTRSRCISEQFLIQLNANQVRYGLVDGFLGMRLVMYKFPSGWDELHPKPLREAEVLNGGYFDYTYPEGYALWGKSHIEKILEQETIGSETTTTTDSDGIVTSTYYVDVNGHPAVYAGDIIINLDDKKAQGKVTEVEENPISVGTLRIHHEAMLGGTSPNIDEGDRIRVVSPHVFNHTMAICPPASSGDEAGEESLGVFCSRSHRKITQADIDDGNDYLEIDLELLTALRWCVCFHAKLAETGIRHPDTLAFKAMYDDAFFEALPDVNQRLELAMNTWKSGLSRNRDYHRITGGGSGPLNNPYNTANIG